MTKHITVLTVVGMLATAALAALPRPAKATELKGELAKLAYFIGDWETDATWNNGGKLNARNEFRIGLGGQFVTINTIVRDGDGPVYNRYQSIYQQTPDGIVAHGFVYDGTAESVPVKFDEEKMQLLTEVDMNGTLIRNDTHRIDENSYRWVVHMKGTGAEEWVPLMNAVWKRTSASVRDIDTTTFAGSGQEVRQFTKTATINAPADKVYAAWASVAGWEGVYDSGSKAHIDLAIGGRYEWLFDGKIGSNGCQVLSYIPNRMISFSWNAPPTQAENRGKHTWVVVELAEQGGKTQVTLTHLGFGEGEKWDETKAYFEAAWPRVLSVMKQKLEAE